MCTFLSDLESIAGIVVSLLVVVFSREVLALVAAGWHRWNRSRHVKRESSNSERTGPTNNISICLSAESVASDITKSTRDKSSRGNDERRNEIRHYVDANFNPPSPTGTRSVLPRTSVNPGSAGVTNIYNDPNPSVPNATAPRRRTSNDGFDPLESDMASFAEQSVASIPSQGETGDDSMTLGACNTSVERTTSVGSIDSDFTILTEVCSQREEPKPIVPIVRAPAKLEKHNAAARIAQSVKRKMQTQRHRYPIRQLSSSSNTMAPDFHMQSSHTIRHARASSSSTSVSEAIAREDAPITLRRRDSIGRRSSLGKNRHEVQQSRLQPPRSFSSDMIGRSSMERSFCPELQRSTSEAIMRSSTHRRTQTHNSMKSSIHSNIDYRENPQKPGSGSTDQSQDLKTSRSFLRSSSDIKSRITPLNSVTESPDRRRAMQRAVSSRLVFHPPPRSSSRFSADGGGRRGCLASSTSFRDLSKRSLPRRGDSMQSTDSGGRRGCLASSKTIRDLSKRSLPRRGSSISNEDLKILRKVESSRNLFNY